MDILHCDNNIVVCIKPVGVDSEHGLPERLKEAVGGEVFTVHRLDKNVGGVMAYARTKAAAAALSRSVQSGDMVKEYLAQVRGVPPESGDWELKEQGVRGQEGALRRQKGSAGVHPTDSRQRLPRPRQGTSAHGQEPPDTGAVQLPRVSPARRRKIRRKRRYSSAEAVLMSAEFLPVWQKACV